MSLNAPSACSAEKMLVVGTRSRPQDKLSNGKIIKRIYSFKIAPESQMLHHEIIIIIGECVRNSMAPYPNGVQFR